MTKSNDRRGRGSIHNPPHPPSGVGPSSNSSSPNVLPPTFAAAVAHHESDDESEDWCSDNLSELNDSGSERDLPPPHENDIGNQYIQSTILNLAKLSKRMLGRDSNLVENDRWKMNGAAGGKIHAARAEAHQSYHQENELTGSIIVKSGYRAIETEIATARSLNKVADAVAHASGRPHPEGTVDGISPAISSMFTGVNRNIQSSTEEILESIEQWKVVNNNKKKKKKGDKSEKNGDPIELCNIPRGVDLKVALQTMYDDWCAKIKSSNDMKLVVGANDMIHKRFWIAQFITAAGGVEQLLSSDEWKHCKNWTDCKNNISKVKDKMKNKQ